MAFVNDRGIIRPETVASNTYDSSVSSDIRDIEQKLVAWKSQQDTVLRQTAFILINDGSGTRIPLYYNPDEITDSYQGMYSDQVILARSEPIRAYAHGGPRSVAYPIVLFANVDPKTEVVDPAIRIRAAQYPRYHQGLLPPPLVTLVVGKLINITGILRQAEIRWKGPWEPQTMYPHRVEISILIEEVNQKAKGQRDVLLGR